MKPARALAAQLESQLRVEAKIDLILAKLGIPDPFAPPAPVTPAPAPVAEAVVEDDDDDEGDDDDADDEAVAPVPTIKPPTRVATPIIAPQPSMAAH